MLSICVGGTNYHPGNLKYRKMVEENKHAYKAATRLQKATMSMQRVKDWRTQQDPPGRFLKLNEETGLWDDVGDDDARVKCAQALREKRASRLSVTESATKASPEPNTASAPSAMTTHAMVPHQPTDIMPTLTQGNLSTLNKCLFAVGVKDVSLSGTVDNEFATIKRAYFQTIIQNHPDRSKGDPAACRYARVAFDVLRTAFHKFRSQNKKIFAAEEGDLAFINDLYMIGLGAWHANFPPSQHFSLAEEELSPGLRVELSPCSSHQCTKCQKTISVGDARVGFLSGKEYEQHQHLKCLSVPIEIWLGLTQPADPAATLRDVLSMDQVFISGLSALCLASQLEIVRHLMKREHWVIRRRKLSNQPQVVGLPSESCNEEGLGAFSLASLDVQQEKSKSAPADDNGAQTSLAGPLKKRKCTNAQIFGNNAPVESLLMSNQTPTNGAIGVLPSLPPLPHPPYP